MKLLTDILDALAAFVRRNPLFTVLVLALAIGAPALLRGIAVFILYFFMGIILLGVVLALVVRWRLARVRREMEERFGAGGAAGFSPRSAHGGRRDGGREGDVEVHRTADEPRKRVSSDVGDYVDFEETDHQ
ncbi:DUF4834 family protein [Alistipes sp.]|uniref:DUF4834 family protein n=1 Tax=Alistipes sp. TaxID=1872444 RepID=UPI000EECA1FA|nr:DUF4834 family protein [Alistipes sp.]HCN13720.1 DUF4834 domain-containing protein [Alistipes sp.]